MDFDIFAYNISPCDRETLKVIFNSYGVVYGGYLRDLIANVEPTDIDAVIPEMYYQRFDDNMKEAGYIKTYYPDHDTYIYIKKGCKNVEIYTTEDSPEDTIISPVSEPDFDVNLLEYDGTILMNWTDPDRDVTPIIEDIKNRIAIRLPGASEDRIEKMRQKGYTIIYLEENI